MHPAHGVDRSAYRRSSHLRRQSVADLEQMVADYAESRIDHILATRGVMLGGVGQPWVDHPWGLPNATELVRLVKRVHPETCIGREGA